MTCLELSSMLREAIEKKEDGGAGTVWFGESRGATRGR
jgi:hypothetical protein